MAKYTKAEIESLIKSLDGKLKEKVEVIAIGGTALSLIGERLYSRDIDLCYLNCKSPVDFTQAVVDSSKDVGIAPWDVEMFHGFEMSLLDIPDFDKRAIPYQRIRLANITLKTMHPADIILTKIYRGDPKDIEDAINLLSKKEIGLQELNTRFIQITRNQKDIEVRQEFIKKYENFMKDYNKIISST